MPAATFDSTPSPAAQATPAARATVIVHHYDPAQQAALETIAGLLFPNAKVIGRPPQPAPACAAPASTTTDRADA
ncbi:MAG: hypothetical protein ABI780_12005 [Ardenticatenales bacterium]